MPYCPKCGVEVDKGVTVCPLCTTGIPEIAPSALERRYPPLKVTRAIFFNQPANTSILVWEIASLFLLIGLFVTTTVDLNVFKGITFSRFTMISLVDAWICMTALSFLLHRPVLLTGSIFLSNLGLLFAVDFFGNFAKSWFLVLGLPISLLLLLVTSLELLILFKTKRHGMNIAAFNLIGVIVICGGIDLLINVYQKKPFLFYWSPVVAISILPVVFLFLYLHFRVFKHIDLKRYFHI